MTRAIRIGGLTAAVVGAWFGLVQPIRHWYLQWGATPAELKRTMPLDDRVAQPNLQITMGITIDAPAEAVWPWLVQMGDPPRAGYYSYTQIERMVGLRVRNESEILPEFQTVEVGETLDKNGTMTVLAVEPGAYLVLGPPEHVQEAQVTWTFALYPIDERRTRLVTRARGAWSYRKMLRSTPPYTWPFYLLVEPGAFLMERKMLKEIKRLAESTQ